MEYAIIASFVVAAISLAGRLVVTFFPPKKFDSLRIPLLSIATGTFLGLVFFDLLPESFEALGKAAPFWVILGMLGFFVLEKFLLGYHHHNSEEHLHGHSHFEKKIKPAGVLVVMGDTVHNFLDGIAIAGAFIVSVPVGIMTSVSIVLHEIPQEIGDMMVLMLSGFSKRRATFWNFISALATVVGAALTLYVLTISDIFVSIFIALAAGGFLYIAMADLMPETKHAENFWAGLWHTVLLILGILLIFGVRSLVPES